MKKPHFSHGFLLFYVALIATAFLANQFVFHENSGLSSSGILALSIAQSSLTGIYGEVFSTQVSAKYIYFSLLISQASGIGFLSYLLWLYWKLCKQKTDQFTIKEALRLTLKVILLSELVLFAYFFYTLSGDVNGLNLQGRSLTALVLSVGAITNSGFTFIDTLNLNHIIRQNYILQIGIIVGSTFGGLGIFVIDELFNPKNLRKRLENPEIDWSLITKISVFGAAILMLIFSFIFYVKAGAFQQDHNILESVIASFYEITSARGLGYDSIDNPTNIFRSIATLISAGPFSSGGGFTLLTVILIYSLFLKKHKKTIEFNALNQLTKNLLIIGLASFIILLFTHWIIEISSGNPFTISKYIEIFTMNKIVRAPHTVWYTDILNGITNMIGRLVFIIACFITLKQKS